MKKKVLFVIVEGPSDNTALQNVIDDMFPNDKVIVCVTYGDITTDKGTNPQNIKSKIGDTVNKARKNYSLKKSDFLGIVHFIDMDGSYIDDSKIIEDSEADKILYYPTEIRTSDKQKIIDRNQGKRAILNSICRTTQIAGIPYYPLYFSCNLDHALFNQLNLSDDEKRDLSNDFAVKYENKPIEFKLFISDPNFAVGKSVDDSWAFIKADNHSLQRFTNFMLLYDIFKIDTTKESKEP